MAHVLTNDLRTAVILAGLQGQLTEQLSSDTPVHQTLQSIRLKQKESSSLKNNKASKKNILLKNEEMIFDIPKTWTWCRIDSLIFDKNDGVHFAPKYVNDGIPCYSAKDIYNDVLNNDRCKYITEDDYLNLMKNKIKVKTGSLLFTKSGSIGRTAIVSKNTKFGLVESVGVLNFVETLPDYVKLIFDYGFIYTNQMFDMNTKGIAVKHLTLTLVGNLAIPLPPIEEQARIVAKVDEIMAKIDEYEKSEKKLEKLEKEFPEDMKASLLQAAMQGKLTEQHPEEDGYAIDLLNQIQEEKKHLVKEGKIKKQPKTKPIMEDEIPFDIPDNWIWARLVNIAKVEMGSSPKGEFIHKGGKGKEFHQGKIYFGKTNLLYSNLKTDKITRCAHSGDILLCVRAPIGEINFTDRDICIGRGLSAISGYSNVSQKYLFYCLKAFKQDLILKGTGSTFKAITANVVKDQLIPLPPLAEQHRIVKKLDELLPLCEILKED
jgi:type I restriction enzyme S subunit